MDIAKLKKEVDALERLESRYANRHEILEMECPRLMVVSGQGGGALVPNSCQDTLVAMVRDAHRQEFEELASVRRDMESRIAAAFADMAEPAVTHG